MLKHLKTSTSMVGSNLPSFCYDEIQMDYIDIM